MATYRVKGSQPEIVENGVDEEVKGAAAGDEGQPKKQNERKRNRNRNNRNRGKSQGPAAAENGKESTNDDEVRPKTAAAAKNKAQQKKPLSKEEQKRQELDRKRKEMSHQYEPFTAKRTFNSRFQEYQFAEWRKRRNNLFVTVETIVPSMPKKPLEEPDDSKYHLDVARIDE